MGMTIEERFKILQDEYTHLMGKHQMMQADYENRLKADMVAMLEEIDLQFDEISFCKRGEWKTVPAIKAEYSAVIREKINTLKGESEDDK